MELTRIRHFSRRPAPDPRDFNTLHIKAIKPLLHTVGQASPSGPSSPTLKGHNRKKLSALDIKDLDFFLEAGELPSTFISSILNFDVMVDKRRSLSPTSGPSFFFLIIGPSS